MALAGWSHYAELTVDGTVPGLGASATGIAKVGIPAALKAECQANGEDLRLTDADDNLLDYGIEDWTAAAPVVHFRRTDWVTGNTICRAYGGNAGASDAQNKANVSQDFALYLPLGDAGPTTAVDWTANGNNGTQSGGVTFGAAGKVGKGCSFDGADDWLNVGNANSLNLTTDMSIMMWINPDTIRHTNSLFERVAISPNRGFMFWTTDSAPNTNSFVLSAYGGNSAYANANCLADSGWQHVAAIRSGTGVSFFVNGVASGSGTLNTILGHTGVWGYIGGGSSWGLEFDGDIDGPQIAPTALTPDQIAFDAESYPGSSMFSWGAVTPIVTAVPWAYRYRLSAAHYIGA